MSAPDFWKDQAEAQKVQQRRRRLEQDLDLVASLKTKSDDLAVLLRVYREAWSQNWGFVPPTEAEARQLAVDLKPIVDPELVLIAEIDGPPDPEVESAWLEEAQRRHRELATGRVRAVPGERVFENLRSRLGR